MVRSYFRESVLLTSNPVALRSFLLLGAVRGMRSHVFVFPVFEFRLGSVVMGQNVGPLVVGATFAIAGLAILFVRS